MEAYSSSYSSSKPKETKGLKHAYPFQSHHYSLLHSVRKSQAKPWKKAPVAPLPPTPIKVYKVHPMNFRYLVQQLTGAPEYFKPQQPHQHFLQRVARATSTTTATNSLDVASTPSPILLSTDNIIAAASSPVCSNKWFQNFQSEALLGVKSHDETTAGGAMASGLLELNLSSPSCNNWCSFPPMSPGTMTILEPDRVL